MASEVTWPRPHRLVAVVGTGTDVGKTWVAARLLGLLRTAGLRVAARKPAQSFASTDDPASRDAAVLGAASGEDPASVCPQRRWYEVAMAPPMAAEVLGRPSFSIADLVSDLRWPADGADIGLVETAGGVRSPLAADGDCLDLCAALSPDVVVLVAHAGLGTINAVRLSTTAVEAVIGLAGGRSAAPIVVLNRFDNADPLHTRNLRWLREHDDYQVVVTPGDEETLAELIRG
jgi:dethiobiotin synthetase